MRISNAVAGVLVAATLLTACGAESGPTAEDDLSLTAESHVADHSRTIIPVSDYFISPCNGETILFTGTIVQQVNLVGPASGGTTHAELQETASFSGTGQTTGASYNVHDVNHVSFNSPTPEAFQTTYTARDHFFFNTSTPGLSFTGTFFIHLIDIQSSGEERVTRELDTLECRT